MLTTASNWVIRRAFGAQGQTMSPLADPEAALLEAKRLSLAPRIGCRTTGAQLEAELGPGVASRFTSEAQRTAYRALKLESQVREMALVAKSLGIRFALLKGAALHLSRASRPGARDFCDLDILAPRGSAVRLFRALKESGWSSETRWRRDHHLPTLAYKVMFPVEIHDYVAIVCGNNGTWATHDDLEEVGELFPLQPFLGTVSLPGRATLAAHLLTHSLAQAPRRRGEYLFRTAGDLLDLGLQQGNEEEFASAIRNAAGPRIPEDVIRHVLDFIVSLTCNWPDGLNAVQVAEDVVREAARSLGLPESASDSPLVMLRPYPGCPTPFRSVVRRVRRSVFVSRVGLDANYGIPGQKAGTSRLWFRRLFLLVRRVVRTPRRTEHPQDPPSCSGSQV